eukprot:4811805-Amphidinium_carterae.1
MRWVRLEADDFQIVIVRKPLSVYAREFIENGLPTSGMACAPNQTGNVERDGTGYSDSTGKMRFQGERT